MTAEEQDFTMNRGESKRIDVPETEDEDTGGTFDMTGFNELTWVLKEERGGSTLVSKTESGSPDVSVTDVSVGAYTVDIVPADTEGISVVGYRRELYHRVRLEDSSGRQIDLMEGTIELRAE